MQTDALLESSRRAEELQYVTRHFRDLQGLTRAPLWAGLLALAVVADLAHCTSGWASLTAYIAVCTLGLFDIEIGALRDWYEQHYGRVTTVDAAAPPPSPILSLFHSDTQGRRLALQGPSWFMICVLVGSLVAALFLPRSCVAFAVPVPLWGVLAPTRRALYRGPFVLTISLRQLLYAAAIAVAGLDSRSTAHLALPPLAGWRAVELFAAILLLATVYDHWLLGRLLGGRKEVEACRNR